VSIKRRLFVAAALLLFSTSVFADCAAPAQAGLRICFPTAGSTVSQAIFEFGWNTGTAAVTRFQLFDNGKQVDDFGWIFEFLIDGGIHDGNHNVTARITDSNGQQHSASVSFNQVGFDPSFDCSIATAGVRLCYPAEAGLAPTNTPLVVAMKGATKITSWAIYVNGKLQTQSSPGSVPTSFATGVTSVPGKNVITVVAKDSAGHRYTTTHHYTAFFADYECSPKGNQCFPGIEVEQPGGFDTAADFPFQATIRDNPDPVTAMNVYLDGVKVAHSTGPMVLTNLHAAHGSHMVTVVGYDTKGHLYEVNETYNVQ
jgi:hypothetical protein